MHPELFRIPFTELTVKSYGTMMVLGFIAAIFVIRRLSRGMGQNAEHITTAALYSLISGVLGARLFYVVHYWDQFAGRNFFSIFAVWTGGLELLGGVITAICTIVIYLRVQKLPVRRYLDILAIGLLLALTFGRIGCMLNGCCFGKPTSAPIAVRFPYDSIPYQSQIKPDLARNRTEPHLDLPAEYFGYPDETGKWIDVPSGGDKLSYYLKPYDKLTDTQKFEVTEGAYRCLPVHPSQIYSSISALFLCMILYFWRKGGIAFERKGKRSPFFLRSGSTFAMLFISYGAARFFIEFLRDDNPFEAAGLTISQNMCIGLIIFGLMLMAVFVKMKPDSLIKPGQN